MSDASRQRTGVGLLIDVARQLRADGERDEASLHQRDRAIGVQLAQHKLDEPQRLAVWLGQVSRTEAPGSLGMRTEAAMQVAFFCLMVLGFFFGMTAATAVFGYDGSQPVNVIKVLAVFVVLQLLVLLCTTILALPAAWRRYVPGLATLQDALALLSPGRLIVAMLRMLPQRYREGFEQLRGRGGVHEQLFGNAYKWAVLLGSQLFAVAFNAGALVGAMALITFSDLAFGWSTTLQLSSVDVHRWTQVISLPWWWLEQARPSVELIELTQYFRRGDSDPFIMSPESDPRMPGGWWPFLVMSILVYGLLPRMVLMYVARRRLAAAVAKALGLLPGVMELRERLERRWVETAAGVSDETSGGAKPQAVVEAGGDVGVAVERGGIVINWSNVPMEEEVLRSRFGGEVVEAGGIDVEADRRAIAAASATDRSAVVVVRAWEPPLGELLDFLRELRGAMGAGRAIVVAPVGVNGHAASQRDLSVWRHKLASVGDPWLKVSVG